MQIGNTLPPEQVTYFLPDSFSASVKWGNITLLPREVMEINGETLPAVLGT